HQVQPQFREPGFEHPHHPARLLLVLHCPTSLTRADLSSDGDGEPGSLWNFPKPDSARNERPAEDGSRGRPQRCPPGTSRAHFFPALPWISRKPENLQNFPAQLVP